MYSAAVGLLLLSVGAAPLQAEETPTIPESSWRVWLEPRFMRTPVSMPAPGADRTDLTGGYLTENGLKNFTIQQFSQLQVPWERFVPVARENATQDLEKLKVTYRRDRNDVIQYAALESPEGLVASAVLSPKMSEKFESTMGPNVIVVVPSRYLGFLFPRELKTHLAYAAMMEDAFNHTPNPVSLEFFEASPKGLRSIGRYSEPRYEVTGPRPRPSGR